MKLLFEKSFLKDIRKVKDSHIKDQLDKIIDKAAQAGIWKDLPHVKKMKGHSSAFRLRIGDYRLGFFIKDDTLIMVRFMHRKDIYKSFH